MNVEFKTTKKGLNSGNLSLNPGSVFFSILSLDLMLVSSFFSYLKGFPCPECRREENTERFLLWIQELKKQLIRILTFRHQIKDSGR